MDKLFKKLHISHLYFWSTSIFVVILFAIVIWASYYFSVQGIIRTTSSYQERILTELNQRLQTQFGAIESVSLSIVRNTELLDLLTNPKETYQNIVTLRNVVASLNTLTFSTPVIYSIDLYVKNAPQSGKQELVRFFDLRTGEEMPWFSSVAQSDFVWIGEHETDSYQGTASVVSFVRKIYSNAGDYQGFVLINIKASDVQTLLREQGFEANRLLLDSGGRVITQTGEQSLVENNENLRSISGSLQEAGQLALKGYRQFPSQYLVVWTNIAGSNWLLIEFTPWEQLVAGSAFMAKVLFTVGIAAVFVLLFIFLFLNRKLTRPIFLLLQAMKMYPAYAADHQLPTDYQNEFGQLFQGYRKLINRIEELYESLRNQYQKQKESEIKALQAMINPHFLYNTLDQLNWMAIKDGNEKMSRVLELTGRMLRVGLSNGESLIPLSEELIHIECYMQIQQIRLGDRIKYSIELPDDIKGYYVPKMTLQPFVENCISHGFHGRSEGRIRIHGEAVQQQLILSIEDNGRGLQECGAQYRTKTKGGYGIRNVRERMEAFFADGYRIDIKNRPEGGTLVTICIPLIEGSGMILEGDRTDVENSHY
ncbi:cache domain-containing sensor histidine kinase [Paenibacillus piri]|uniref:Sensor histidine kinase n=1 Tax=Paenibacillus piri TaxID=2547395 RepID=A0A4R5K8U1_9BACL|nr:sensor histidine kinase [Paenibacillus piri]TDF90600.1 sensor histidine kinase [Paenibacillus piri]